ncbi:MAG: DUF3052 domain-containing protein [Actinobacteria bacterium HGW-Actinobacteria-2]|nr:MAG: DUF3052 domain-containing protein [Actinobacteria bacterium HGW-Actinobacteria-2]
MTTAPGPASSSAAAVLGFSPGSAVQELGWDSDVDDALRTALLDVLGEDFVYEAVEAVDVVLLWWREEDGDLGDGLVDALTDLSSTGHIWLLTPRVGRPGYVEPSDLADAALTAGLALANSANVSKDWQAQKLVRPKGVRR